MWRLVSGTRRRLGRSICRFTWHNSTPDSGTIALEAPATSLSPAEVIFPSLPRNNSKWAGLPAKGLRKATASTKVIDLNNVCTLQIHFSYCCLFLAHFPFTWTLPFFRGTDFAWMFYLYESIMGVNNQINWIAVEFRFSSLPFWVNIHS